MADDAFLPLHTGRLTLRAFTAADAVAFAEYRNDPEVARFQDWELPVSRQAAAAFVASQRDVTGPAPGQWVQIAVDDGDGLAGDLAVGLDESGALAKIGYTIRADRQGRGYGREAIAALVDALFDRAGVHRIAATLDPHNTASARLLEQVGFRYEGCAKAAAAVRGRWEDDDCYAMLRSDRQAWLARPTGSPAEVRLVEITPENVRAVAELATHHSQERFVSTVADSFRDALVPAVVNGEPVVPWMRAILADGELAGFVMIADATAAFPVPYLWRLLVDRRQQRRRLGARAVELVATRLRAAGHRRLKVSWVDEPGGPAPFYRRLGFVPTGEIKDGEVQAVLPLD